MRPPCRRALVEDGLVQLGLQLIVESGVMLGLRRPDLLELILVHAPVRVAAALVLALGETRQIFPQRPCLSGPDSVPQAGNLPDDASFFLLFLALSPLALLALLLLYFLDEVSGIRVVAQVAPPDLAVAHETAARAKVKQHTPQLVRGQRLVQRLGAEGVRIAKVVKDALQIRGIHDLRRQQARLGELRMEEFAPQCAALENAPG